MEQKRSAVGPAAGVIISLVAATALAGIAAFDLYLFQRLSLSEPLPVTVRTPLIGTYRDTITGGASYRPARLVEARGDRLDPRKVRLVQAYEQLRRPPGKALLLGLVLASALLFFLYTAYLRVLGGPAGLLRTQLVLTGLVLLLALAAKAVLVFTDLSPFWIPLLVVSLPVAFYLGPRIAAATSVVGALCLSILTPVDMTLMVVLAAQGLAAGAVVRPHGRVGSRLGAVLAGCAAGLVAYVSLSLLIRQYIPVAEASSALGFETARRSDLLASCFSPLLGGILSVFLAPALQRLLGQVPRSTLTRLADFEHPLLRRMASRAPGTWAHSLNMANMAEMAANATGANGLLVRVGAYYHDLGKSDQPEYFIENQEGNNPHDELEPEVSVDAITSHVAAGVKLARKHKIPQGVVEFVYTHHGNDRLEYFWHKKIEGGAREGDLVDDDYRYSGSPPTSRETAILALCDSVEAASRSMDSRGPEHLQQLVRQIVFTKLRAGLLDESGLSVADLRKVMQSLIETLQGSMHGRIKYPWQDQQAEQAGAARSAPAKTRRMPFRRPSTDAAVTVPRANPRGQGKRREGTRPLARTKRPDE